ncbi:TadE/TadG family type IV pilus assembly protein [Bradyrhizobium sp. BR 1432]|uniref:TadE/TadG family type IV pilus assembly protein n=1 Tax=Bradyrhizobium sp. BR 1432 TaxID=3447966 RepID=UPI003EE79EAC
MWHDNRGASALEFALTAPAFFLFIFGIIECGLLFWTQLGIQHGSEMAARCATRQQHALPSSSAITSYAAQQAFGLTLPADTFTFSTSASRQRGKRELCIYVSGDLQSLPGDADRPGMLSELRPWVGRLAAYEIIVR